MNELRTDTIYLSHNLCVQLRIVAKAVKASCIEEYVEQVLTEHLRAMYGDKLDKAVTDAGKAWAKAIDEAMEELDVNTSVKEKPDGGTS